VRDDHSDVPVVDVMHIFAKAAPLGMLRVLLAEIMKMIANLLYGVQTHGVLRAMKSYSAGNMTGTGSLSHFLKTPMNPEWVPQSQGSRAQLEVVT
jgi:hypothetical protein